MPSRTLNVRGTRAPADSVYTGKQKLMNCPTQNMDRWAVRFSIGVAADPGGESKKISRALLIACIFQAM